MAEISPLRRRMIEDMTVRNLSPATQRSYINAVQKFSRHFGHSPDRLDLEDVRAFQVYLVSGGISWAALNQIVCALRFFYGVTLSQNTVPERVAYAREPNKLPVVLSADEVVRFLEAIPSLKSRADHGLCRRTARVGSRSLKDRRHRQPADGDPGRAGQGRQGPLRHALSAAPEDFTHLLAARSTEAMAVSRP
jgi:integrase